MSNFRFGLRCDLCPAVLDSREDFDNHMRDAHGTTSLKPRSVVKRAGELLRDLAQITGRPVERMSRAEAEAGLARFREQDRLREEAEKRRRELAEDFDHAALKRSFKSGWLTFRASKGAANGMAMAPFETGEATANFVYHRDGSWIQFETPGQRDKYVAELNFYLKLDSSHPAEERLDVSETENMKRFVHLAEKAKPWTEEDLPSKASMRYAE